MVQPSLGLNPGRSTTGILLITCDRVPWQLPANRLTLRIIQSRLDEDGPVQRAG
jgi:hypothetical protein